MTTDELRALCESAGITAPISGLLRPSEVCEILDVCDGTLQNWRRRGIGPPAQRVGARWRYRIDDVAAYITATTESKSVNQGQQE